MYEDLSSGGSQKIYTAQSQEKTKFINFNLRNKFHFLNPVIYKCVYCLCQNTNYDTSCADVSEIDFI